MPPLSEPLNMKAAGPFTERLYISFRLHGVTCQKTKIFTVIAKRASTVIENRILNRSILPAAQEEVTGQTRIVGA